MADKKSFRKSQLIAFGDVAAGHDGMLSDPSNELVIKPCDQSEIDFYESTAAHLDLIPHIPTFIGKINLAADTAPAPAAGALFLPSEIETEPQDVDGAVVIKNNWQPATGEKVQANLAVVLENVAGPSVGFKKPNILDVKIGARLWGDDAKADKRARLDKVAAATTSKPLGLRICGMRIFQGAQSQGEKDVAPDAYRLYDKQYGRALTVDTVHEGFREFFLLAKEAKASGPIRKVIRRFIEDLKALETVIQNSESRIYSSSLLFVYEGDQQALQDAFTLEKESIESLARQTSVDAADGGGEVEADDDDDDDDDDEVEEVKFPAIQSLKLIDFAHAQWTPGKGCDENFLHGIRNVIKILIDITS